MHLERSKNELQLVRPCDCRSDVFLKMFKSLVESLRSAPIRVRTVLGFVGSKPGHSIYSRFSMDFAIFRRNFDEILPEFHRNGQEMTKCLEILKKMREKFGKWQKFPEFVRNFIRSFHFSFVSVVM